MKTWGYCWAACLLSGCALAVEDCPGLDSRFKEQVQSRQMDAAEATLRQMSVCPPRVVGADERYFTDTLASQAETLATGGQLGPAEALLRKAGRNSWMVSSVRGYIASKKQPVDWGEVAQHYSYALEQLTDPADPALKDVPDLQEKRRHLFALAADAQLLYGKPAPAARDGQPNGLWLALERGVDPGKPFSFPVHFETNRADLDEDGKLSADDMAEALLRQKPAALTLTGHADERGGVAYNQRLSEQRAETLARYLRGKGVDAKITTVGKGKSEPPLMSALNPPKELLWQRSRRVELSLGNEEKQP